MGPKFWKIYRKDGLMRTLLRGKTYKQTHDKGGYGEEVARLVGSDEFGNRYYEDFAKELHNKNQRRWVEYADYASWQPTGKKVGPGWQGWLHYMYDDPPKKDNFVEPFYRPHRTVVLKSDHPTLGYLNPGHLLNDEMVQNEGTAKERVYAAWQPPQAVSK